MLLGQITPLSTYATVALWHMLVGKWPRSALENSLHLLPCKTALTWIAYTLFHNTYLHLARIGNGIVKHIDWHFCYSKAAQSIMY